MARLLKPLAICHSSLRTIWLTRRSVTTHLLDIRSNIGVHGGSRNLRVQRLGKMGSDVRLSAPRTVESLCRAVTVQVRRKGLRTISSSQQRRPRKRNPVPFHPRELHNQERPISSGNWLRSAWTTTLRPLTRSKRFMYGSWYQILTCLGTWA